MFAAPLLGLLPDLLLPSACGEAAITIHDTRTFPVMSIRSKGRRLLLINAGDRYVGTRILAAGLRDQGHSGIEAAIIAAVDPQAGIEGLAALIERMPVQRAFLPLLERQPGTYLDDLGDEYLAECADDGKLWAVRFQTAYDELRAMAGERGTDLVRIQPGTPLATVEDLSIHALPVSGFSPRRFVNKARSVLLRIDMAGYRWLVVTDGMASMLDAAARADTETLRADVLVLPFDTFPRTRHSDTAATQAARSDRRAVVSEYMQMIDRASEHAQPRLVIMVNGEPNDIFDPAQWVRQHGNRFELLTTAAEGAILVRVDAERNLVVEGSTSRRRLVLPPRQ